LRIPDGVWTHLAVTIDTVDTHEAALYVNGVRQGVARVLSNNPYRAMFLGTSAGGGYFAGEIDEVAIFKRVFPADQLALHANAKEPFPDPLLAPPSDSMQIRPMDNTTYFTFKHPELGRRRWIVWTPEFVNYLTVPENDKVPFRVSWQLDDDRTRAQFWFAASDEEKRKVSLDFSGRLVANRDEIGFELWVKNAGESQWKKGVDPLQLVCLQSGNAEGFQDPTTERTYIHREGHWVSLSDDAAARGEAPPRDRCTGFPVRRAGMPGVERLTARVSEDGRFVLGIATSNADSVGYNFTEESRIYCMHSNPSWEPLKPGEEATAEGKIYLIEGTLDDLWKRYCADFPVE